MGSTANRTNPQPRSEASGIRGRNPFQLQVEPFDLRFNQLPLIPDHVDHAQQSNLHSTLGRLYQSVGQLPGTGQADSRIMLAY
jgi:hypothetical protein